MIELIQFLFICSGVSVCFIGMVLCLAVFLYYINEERKKNERLERNCKE